MTDLQILTMAIAIVFPIAAMIGGNMRISDFRDSTGKRMDDFRDSTNTRIDRLEQHMDERLGALEKRLIEHLDNGFEHVGLLLKLHEAEHHKK